ncbi:MAG TPA: ribosome small subunit-dependent GTPase A [Halanaerobiales bacterium]|nr:ribosome small subunit-dependent GTPase A [Halanaerobiales bacterium]
MQKGIITKTIGGFFFVGDEDRNIIRTKIRGRIQKMVYPGDKVGFKDKIIEEVYPRENLLHRPKIANVDQVVLVLALSHPEFDRTLFDRFLVLLEAFNLDIVIAINKIDLAKKENINLPNLNDYNEAGYNIVYISAKKEKNIEKLYPFLKDKVSVLTGPSGVGKSTLINSLIENADMETREVSKKLKRGVQTTRHVELIPLKKGGWLADTPGFTSLDINKIKSEKLKYLFPEFNGYLAKCKFSTCSHTHEPGCALKKAVKDGEISKKRYESYKKFYNEIKEKE